MEQSDWHSIRPWSHRFSLSVREVTSVSATFVLSSSFNAVNDTELASLGIAVSDDEDNSTSQPNRIVVDTLSKGLAVKVNNSPWQRVLLRIDEEKDEATIIVLDLNAGRVYDIELEITRGQLRGQITTDQSVGDAGTLKEESLLPIDGLQSQLSSDSPSPSPTASTSTMDASSNSTSPSTTFTLEDRVQQLDHTLSVLQSERETLINALKSSRKDAQKTEAAARSEIDALKRASDKYSSVENRARQKVLALQETVKQTLAAASESEALVVEAEVRLPILREQIETAEGEYKAVKEKAEKVREEKKMLERKERKRTESMQNELASLTSKLEKLNGRKEKLEMGTIPDLEEELKGIEIEIERAERDSLGFEESVEETDMPENTDNQEQHTVHQRSYRRRHSRTGKSKHPPIQRPIQILRPPQRSQKPAATQTCPSTSAMSTLSSLARPFEPSPTRQAQLQSTLQPASVKSELNPASTIFSPRGVPFQPSTWARNTSSGGQS